MDLVSCRNTLMYFTPEVQGRVLAKLYMAVRAGRALVTGMTERPTVWSELFRSESRRHPVYRPAAGMMKEALALLARRPPARRRPG